MTLLGGSPQTVPPGLVVAAPASGSGKTLVTLGLLRHLRDVSVIVASAKVGPDYIDPAFHAAASGRPCVNMDLWAMRPATLADNLTNAASDAEMLVCEGVMGLFDGARLDEGSTADAAAHFGWPVVLVVDARAQGASAAAVVRGFAQHRGDVEIAGVIFNRIGSPRHADILTNAMAASLPDIPVLGCLPRLDDLKLPDRHLGLVQAQEHGDLDAFLNRAAAVVAEHVDIDKIRGLSCSIGTHPPQEVTPPIPPLGQRIAIAHDDAFSFTYPHIINGWRRVGSEISWFSPLADQLPDKDTDAIYLPGGYPELHAGKLAENTCFLAGLRDAAANDVLVFGECGGYMVLGDRIVDADGKHHAMAGLLPLETSFAERKLHLGYRRAVLSESSELGVAGTILRGHEFHYATILNEDRGEPLFTTFSADDDNLGGVGQRQGNIMGSFIHLIDHEDKDA